MRQSSGFTLIELMMVVVIIAIIMSLSIPYYGQYVVQKRRVAAMAALSELAIVMAQHRSENHNYRGAATGGNDTGPPQSYRASIKGYNLRIEDADDTSYELRAIPIASGSQAEDGYLMLNSLTERQWDQNNNSTIESDENDWEED